jgi:hypothetical protein
LFQMDPLLRREGVARAGEQGTRKRAGEIRPLSALAVPTASEAATVEAATVEAATVEAAKTSYMGDAHTVRETATSEMGDTYAAIHAAQAAHTVAQTMIEAAVVGVAIKYGGVAVIGVIIPT